MPYLNPVFLGSAAFLPELLAADLQPYGVES
jgi:hypothetical protein